MKKDIFESNLNSIGRWVDTWEPYLREKCNEEQNDVIDYEIEIHTEEAMSGDTIFSVIDRDGVKLYLSGKYNPVKYARDWIEEKELRNSNGLVIVLGLGDGVFVKEVLSYTGKYTKILVYEPSFEIFKTVIQEVDLTTIFTSKRVGLVVDGMNSDEWQTLVNSGFDIDLISQTNVYINPNYKRLFSQKIHDALQIVTDRFKYIRINWNTMMRYTAYSGINIIRNLKYLLTGYTINRLYHVLPKTFPCIIVAAGPSLNRNIDELKKVQKRACIIACDTAMKPLLSHGIVPDFFLVVDAMKPKLLLDYPGVENIPFVTTLAVPNDIMKFHTGKKFFYFCGESLFKKAVDFGYKDRVKPVPIEEGVSPLKTGGSVATSAYALAEFMGSETIILVGQDLAFTGNKSHADGTFDDKMEEMDYISDFPQVEDIHGDMVYTAPDMKAYLEWYEKEIEEHPDYKVIDATEGGALIKGTEIMTLSDAIDKYCNQEIDIQWHINQIPELFEEIEKQYVVDYINTLPQKANHILEEVKLLKADYKKMGYLAKKEKKINDAIELSCKITNKIKCLEDDEIYMLMVSFMKCYEYTIRASLNQEEDNEILSIAKQGELYLDCMENIMNLVIPEMKKELEF